MTTTIKFQDFVNQHPTADFFRMCLRMYRDSDIPLVDLAIDMGQGGTKIAKSSEDGEDYTMYAVPSFFKEQNVGNVGDLAAGTAKKRQIGIPASKYDKESYYLTYDNRHFIYGRAAEEGGTANLNNRRRYIEEQSRIALMVAGSSMLEKCYPGKQEAVILVVTHVPQDTYSEELVNEIITKNSKTYSFTTHSDAGDKDYTLHIVVMEVLVEGTGAAIRYGRDDDGLCGVFDGGRGTSDFLLYRGIQADLEACFNENLGVSTIEGILNGLVEDKYGRKLDQAEIRQVLRAYVQIVTKYGYKLNEEMLSRLEKIRKDIKAGMPTSYVLSKESLRIQIDPLFLFTAMRQASEAVAGRLISIMRSHWGNAQGVIGEKFAAFIFVGGILYFIRPYLEEDFDGITIYPNYEYGNVCGLASRALSTVLFDLFDDEESR